MPDASTTWVVISAIRHASATLRGMAANVTESTEQVAASSRARVFHFGGLTGSIVLAQFAYQALFAAYEHVKDFFSDSIGAAFQSVRHDGAGPGNVENAGLSYDRLSPKLDAVAKATKRWLPERRHPTCP